MNVLLIVVALVLALAGFSVSMWSFYDTRSRYYQDYLNRKRREQ